MFPTTQGSTVQPPILSMKPEGTIVFTTLGAFYYGFDVFSVPIPSTADHLTELRHTDGVSVNYNAHFLHDSQTVAFVSDRSGSPRLYQSSSRNHHPTPLPTVHHSLFHDRPTVKNGNLYFVSNHEPLPSFHSSAAVYCAELDTHKIIRLTPAAISDLSPAISKSGKLLAVASYGSGPWKGEVHELPTNITVFSTSNPSHRSVLCRGGWPTWSSDSTIYFHRVAEDGWWSIFRTDVDNSVPERITPPGVHAFTPAASNNGKYIAVATHRKGRKTRQIELFNLESEQFHPITELTNPDFHHYNPFFSPDSSRIGYHRFRGESVAGGSVVPHLQAVRSLVSGIRLLHTPYTFPCFSPDGKLIAVNGDLQPNADLMIIKSDGTKRWTLLKDPAVFYTAWSRGEKGVLFVSMGRTFEPPQNATVQIARVTFDMDNLTDDVDEVPVSVKILTANGTGNNAFPSCSPDGRQVVFRSGRSGYKNLYILDGVNGESENGSGIRRLTDGEWTDTMACWSPDGNLIAFASNRHNPLFKDQEGFGLYIVRPDGTGLHRVVLAETDTDRERINHVCFSPDSKWLLFSANLGGVSAEPVGMPNQFQPYGDLYTCRLDGSDLKRLTYNAYENATPAWYSGNTAPHIQPLSPPAPDGDKLKGQFVEPIWINSDM